MGRDHVRELRSIIARGEREHRAFGARLLGKRPSRGLTMRETEDLFIARCFAAAASRHPEGGCLLYELEGVRDDYVFAARMWENAAFRTVFCLRLEDVGAGGFAWVAWIETHADYARFQP